MEETEINEKIYFKSAVGDALPADGNICILVRKERSYPYLLGVLDV